jgi:CO/xanthine dehydrogenase Mo-binding subunit
VRPTANWLRSPQRSRSQTPTKFPLNRKPVKDFRLIGTPIPRIDVPGKVDGTAAFGIDVRLPGMLFAVIARCPQFGGKLQSFDATQARAIPGVRAIFPIAPIAFLPKINAHILMRTPTISANYSYKAHRQSPVLWR